MKKKNVSKSPPPPKKTSVRKGHVNFTPDDDSAVPSHRHYHPYQDLKVPITNLFTLPNSPEYLFHEESLHRHRSWVENLQYYAGTSYILGSVSGGVKGTVHGVRSAEPGDSLKLRVNRVLNEGGKMGRRWGNNLGVLGLLFAGVESGMVYWRDTDDMINSVVAGLGTGALYKAAAGPRSAAIAGAIGGIAAGVAVAGKQAAKRYVPI